MLALSNFTTIGIIVRGYDPVYNLGADVTSHLMQRPSEISNKRVFSQFRVMVKEFFPI